MQNAVIHTMQWSNDNTSQTKTDKKFFGPRPVQVAQQLLVHGRTEDVSSNISNSHQRTNEMKRKKCARFGWYNFWFGFVATGRERRTHSTYLFLCLRLLNNFSNLITSRRFRYENTSRAVLMREWILLWAHCVWGRCAQFYYLFTLHVH